MSKKSKRRKRMLQLAAEQNIPRRSIPAIVVGRLEIETETSLEILPPRFVSRIDHISMPKADELEKIQEDLEFPEDYYYKYLCPFERKEDEVGGVVCSVLNGRSEQVEQNSL